MESANVASVLIVDQQLEHRGILANAAFVVGLTAGRELPGATFGTDTEDADGSQHRYLTRIGHLVRKAGQSKLRTLRSKLLEIPAVQVVDYTEDAAPANYEEYAQNLKTRKGEEISYRAIHVFGPSELIVPLTKNLSRLD